MDTEVMDLDIWDIQDDILYFRYDLQTDAWKKGNSCIKGTIENYFKECLEAHPEDPSGCVAMFANPSDPERRTFEVQTYRTNILTDGLSVTFTVTVDNEKYCMCCSETMELTFKRGKCPNTIEGDRSEIIFFQKQFSAGYESFKFESSLHKDYFLAFREENGKRKLILKKPNDVVDETTMFNIN
ncbi:interleukin-18 isoform X2 [Mixophyes fleayi]|uniref:interleukin-18 isoform X2 n=1 Tax=Mixophyes fleayi TaxID=3061075 RepID=UPI003F4DAD56